MFSEKECSKLAERISDSQPLSKPIAKAYLRRMKQPKILLLGLFVSLFSTTIYGVASSRSDPAPYKLIPYGSTNYLEQLATLRENEPRYRNTPLWDEFAQLLGTTYSYVGNYQAALTYFDSLSGVQAKGTESQRQFTDCTARDALESIVQKAATHQAVFINEAHHVPQHRVLTRGVLEALYQQGFRYFAAETLNPYDTSLDTRGYPVLKETGYYTDEPLYGDLIRHALKLGYTVIPYESQGTNESQNKREAAQAQNLIERIFRNDPGAKLIVHAGYGHIDEQGGEGWIPMAKVFKQLSGIDPLTVDQTSMSEHSRPKYESVRYREAVAAFGIDDPIIVECKGEPWVAPGYEGKFDLMTFLPRSVYVDGRPTWLSLAGARKAYLLATGICQKKLPCLVQARYQGESLNAVPVDQIEVRDEAKPTALMLPKGVLDIRVLDAQENLIQDFEVRN